MLTLLASSRALVDRWRESRGSLRAPRPISGAIPGVGPAIEALGGLLALRPAPFLLAIGVITILLGIAARDIETVFNTDDFLPSGGEAIRNIETMGAAFGGSTANVNVLIEAEVTDNRTIRNLFDFSEAFFDDLSRPEGVVGGIQSSLGLLLIDWITDDGTEGDNYDPELLEMALAANEFRLDPAQIQAIIDRLEDLDPDGFARVAVNNPDGPDTLLMTFQALTGDQARTGRMVDDVNGLWFGDDEALTPVSGDVLGIEVVDTMTSNQTTSILGTILAALAILVIFFWVTEDRPGSGFHRGGADRAGADLGAGNHDAAGNSLQRRHRPDYGVVHRNRSGLHHTHNPPIRTGIRLPARPGGGGAAHASNHRLGVARLGPDHRAGIRRADLLVAGALPAVRSGHCYYHSLRPHRRCHRGAALDDSVGRLPELPATERSRPRGARAVRLTVGGDGACLPSRWRNWRW